MPARPRWCARFLATPEGRGTAVVINEFGAVGIDDALVRDSADEITLLGNGCLCCTTRSDLQIALRRLVAERERGAVPRFARIVIETSGLADPGPILQTFATDRALGDEFFVEVVVAVVDAVGGLDNARMVGGSAQAGDPRRPAGDLEDRPRRAAGGRVPAATAARAQSARRHRHGGRRRARSARLDRGGGAKRCATMPASSPRPSTATASSASCWSDDAPLPWDAFARAMETLIALRGPDLLRVKGFLNVDGCRGPVLVQFVQHLAHPPVELAAWPDADHASRLVFITRNIAEPQVRDLLAAVRALAMPPAP